MLERELRDANSSSQLQQVANQVEAVREIMERNVEMLLDRGEKLDALNDKADELHGATKAFSSRRGNSNGWHLMNQAGGRRRRHARDGKSVAIPIAVLAAA